MDNNYQELGLELKNILNKINDRLENLENKIGKLEYLICESPKSKTNDVIDFHITDKNETTEKKTSKKKTTIRNNYFDNKNETKLKITNEKLKKCLKIRTNNVSRIDMKKHIIKYLGDNISLSETQALELDITEICLKSNIKFNEKIEFLQFEHLLNNIMSIHCLKNSGLK